MVTGGESPQVGGTTGTDDIVESVESVESVDSVDDAGAGLVDLGSGRPSAVPDAESIEEFADGPEEVEACERRAASSAMNAPTPATIATTAINEATRPRELPASEDLNELATFCPTGSG